MLEILRKLLPGIRENFLNDVGQINPRPQPAVHADRYHATEPILMQDKQLLPSAEVPMGGPVEELSHIPWIQRHMLAVLLRLILCLGKKGYTDCA
jgi:hypothetical protein